MDCLKIDCVQCEMSLLCHHQLNLCRGVPIACGIQRNRCLEKSKLFCVTLLDIRLF